MDNITGLDDLEPDRDESLSNDLAMIAREFFTNVYGKSFVYLRFSRVEFHDGLVNQKSWIAYAIGTDLSPCFGHTRSSAILLLVSQCLQLVEGAGAIGQTITTPVRNRLLFMGAKAVEPDAFDACQSEYHHIFVDKPTTSDVVQLAQLVERLSSCVNTSFDAGLLQLNSEATSLRRKLEKYITDAEDYAAQEYERVTGKKPMSRGG